MPDSIVVSHATKVIRGRVVLDDVTFSLPRGGIYGFSGINGSGKTMLFRAISGLIHLTSGEVDVFGQRVGVDVDFPQGLGLVLESAGFLDEGTGLRNLMMLASIRGVVGEREAREALGRVGLDADDGRPFSAYSMGMRQRLDIAQAIMEAPELLILDEPTNALDVGGIEIVSRIVREEHERGCTVLVACHNEPALEALFEREWHMSDGRIAGEVDRR
ncbi:MAG: ABC transporter ATP-binding protein [Coriobacteriaceae bacterium]|uniref:ABC transporter ATP-binding protein n=1 Tax=Tractidigestivibacter sp. TaxID=2847320 RepID=UPI002A91609B|nr:ABC transporter ATP-binding protein [Tractidigestivibacter sp.]MCI6274241.1 ABC transporter ATP-binding protein [Coriobacteriaceae bacterium]MCI7438225.1 ABC transporter ATP-binding protein [Coriobacteriaceae bacterium]MDY5272355.1 ABC transporter ATP-binding protein [Tractidigestivibacter sp.]